MINMESIKTTIDIPNQTLADAMRFTKATTKREAVLVALEDFNRRKKLEGILASFGTWNIATNDEIEAGDIEEITAKRK